MSPFAFNLRVMRIRSGMSQLDLCKALQVDRGRVSAWETGIRPAPDPSTIARICQVLGADQQAAAKIQEAAEFSVPSVQLSRHAAPEIYELMHKLARIAPKLSSTDTLILDHFVAQLTLNLSAKELGPA